jgi:putative glutamine amidotransferase
MTNIDCFIISGGETTEAREFTETQCYADAVKKGIPVIGVCHGAFVLNRWHLGSNDVIDGHSGTEHTITMEDNSHTVNSFHKVCIGKLARDFNPIAWTDTHTEAFKHTELPIWGLVWHPERMTTPVLPNDLKELLLG